MIRIRTIQQAAKEFKEVDSNTAVTEFYIRSLAKSGEIPAKKTGNKYLINMELLEKYLEQGGDGNGK